jgi:N utilization substance protein B
MPLSRRDQRLRRRARARTLQALYAWDIKPQAGLPAVSERVWDDLAVGPSERALAMPILREIHAHAPEIDRTLAELSANWRFERLGAIERSVLRLGLAELRLGFTPPRVVIQEAVSLAERYSSSESARFVNGVLDAAAHRLGSI